MPRLVASALLAACLLAPGLAAGAAPVALTEPADGTVLVPGRTAVVAWEPTEAWTDEETSRIEEWEAFLSVDGGASYPYRITPHLDWDISTFRFQVPGVASDDVRLLIRMGDERREVGFEMPGRFAIARAGILFALRRPSLAASGGVARRGEAARPGDAGVGTWVEGGRRGENLRLRSATLAASLRGRAPEWNALRLQPLLVPPQRSSSAGRDSERPRQERVAVVDSTGRPDFVDSAPSILLLIQRSNT